MNASASVSSGALQPLTFRCGDDRLVGLLHRPRGGAAAAGVLVVVGGPQYRVGSARQFVRLANGLAEDGVATLRFDYRGMGDSDGEFRGFLHADDDIRAAVDAFFEACPELTDVALWGLCDGASSSLLYAHRDRRVSGLVLLNPWVHSDQGEARVRLKHYYVQRLLTPAFWAKVVRLRFDPLRSAASLASHLRRALRPAGARAGAADAALPYQQRMLEGLRRFHGKVLLICSGNDYVAHEFQQLVDDSADWQTQLADARVERRRIDDADHTFSRRVWADQVQRWTADWLQRELRNARP